MSSELSSTASGTELGPDFDAVIVGAGFSGLYMLGFELGGGVEA